MTDYLVRDCRSYKRNEYKVFLGIFDSFANRIRNLACLTDPSANPAFAVPDNYECTEAKTASAFYYFSYAVNIYNSFSQF
ncbi:hypothetical protein D3C79_1087810 [compost metagenome]